MSVRMYLAVHEGQGAGSQLGGHAEEGRGHHPKNGARTSQTHGNGHSSDIAEPNSSRKGTGESLEVRDFKKLVRAIRNVEAAFGDAIKQPSPSESENIVAARKSIVAKTVIKQGEQFSRENLTVKRPGTGVSPMEWDQLVGQISTRSYKVNEQIESS